MSTAPEIVTRLASLKDAGYPAEIFVSLHDGV